MQKPTIIYEDDDIIVCHKPAGMATQTKRLGQQDMESSLRNYRARKKETPYIGVVHRLDQPVEGIMVFAKNQKAAANLSRQVQQRLIGKHYYAECIEEGEFSMACGHKGTLTNYILTDKKNNVSSIVPPDTPQAKKAVLDFEVIKEENNHIVFDVTLHTGRQHQIRLQLANIGCPIIGDNKYGGAPDDTLKLRSYMLEFEHPASGKKMQFIDEF